MEHSLPIKSNDLMAHELTGFLKIKGVKNIRSHTSHPQTNGKVESGESAIFFSLIWKFQFLLMVGYSVSMVAIIFQSNGSDFWVVFVSYLIFGEVWGFLMVVWVLIISPHGLLISVWKRTNPIFSSSFG